MECKFEDHKKGQSSSHDRLDLKETRIKRNLLIKIGKKKCQQEIRKCINQITININSTIAIPDNTDGIFYINDNSGRFKKHFNNSKPKVEQMEVDNIVLSTLQIIHPSILTHNEIRMYKITADKIKCLRTGRNYNR